MEKSSAVELQHHPRLEVGFVSGDKTDEKTGMTKFL